MSEFAVIPNQQTPKVPEIEDIELFFIQNIKKLQEFKNYAYERFDAVGLAANQCNLDGERFMARVFALREINNNGNPQANWRLIIDPRIIEYIGMKEIKVEGCLTWRGRRIVAERSRAVRVSYFDEIGQSINHELHYGFEGQVWQHEINHLNGVEERIEEIDFVQPKSLDIQRNDKCPCGSGKKYKQCCLLYL
jgi:peptide deformylase